MRQHEADRFHAYDIAIYAIQILNSDLLHHVLHLSHSLRDRIDSGVFGAQLPILSSVAVAVTVAVDV